MQSGAVFISRTFCFGLTEMMLQELSLLVYRSDVTVPFLDSLRQDLSGLLPLLLSTTKRGETALRLLLLMGKESSFFCLILVNSLLISKVEFSHLVLP